MDPLPQQRFVAWLLSTRLLLDFMACFEVIILKNRVKRAFEVEDVINSTEKEGRTNEISLSLDLINVKDGSNFSVRFSKP